VRNETQVPKRKLSLSLWEKKNKSKNFARHPLDFPFRRSHEAEIRNFCVRFANIKDVNCAKRSARVNKRDGRIISIRRKIARFETSDIASRVIIDRQSADVRLQTTLIARVAADIAVGSFNIS